MFTAKTVRGRSIMPPPSPMARYRPRNHTQEQTGRIKRDLEPVVVGRPDRTKFER
jgi:hypothetical protein